MSVLLLLERKRAGRGPKIPLKDIYTKARVEGLIDGDILGIECNEGVILLDGNGLQNLPSSLVKGNVVCGSLIGNTSCVTLQLEN